MWCLLSLLCGDSENLFSGKREKKHMQNQPVQINALIWVGVVGNYLLLTSKVNPVLPVPIKATGASADKQIIYFVNEN